LDSKDMWRAAMQEPATHLENYLWRQDQNLDYGQCTICQERIQSLASHIAGKNHWNRLGRKVEWKPPSRAALTDLTQCWKCADGSSYWFNHFTGDQGVGDAPQAQSDTPQVRGKNCGPECHEKQVEKRSTNKMPRQTAGDVEEDETAQGWTHVEWKTQKDKPNRGSGYQQNEGLGSSCPRSCIKEGVDGVRCDGPCQLLLPWSSFHKSQQKASLEYRLCIPCRAKKEEEQRIVKCQTCSRSLDYSAFLKNSTDWSSPVCRECFEKKQEEDYSAWLQEKEREAEARQKEREAMDEAALRQYFADKIVARAGAIPQHHDDTRFVMCKSVDNELWLKAVLWAQRLAEKVQSLMKSGRLPKVWLEETPSRDHASAKQSAKQFKDLEDLGDRFVQEKVAELYMELVAGEQVKRYSLLDLRRAVRPLEGGRSWCLRDTDSVVIGVRPASAWPEGFCQMRDLRAEPRSGMMYPGKHMFAQFDNNAQSVLCKSQPALAVDSMFDVKICKTAFWEAVEMELYQGSSEIGSHNQTFSRAYGYAAGSAQAANWTEVMNLFADLLGFFDDDPGKPRNSLGRSIWAEHFGHLFPQRLKVCYGAGGEFRADKEWVNKMEANVAEALIGALKTADLDDLAVAASVLCFLCYALWPEGVLPSNWAMAEKVLEMQQAREHGGRAVNDSFCQKHIDLDVLKARMEHWLGH